MTEPVVIGPCRLYLGDCRDVLPTLDAGSVNCCVTSPPYFGLRSYLPDAVYIKEGLSKEDFEYLHAELQKHNIHPITVGL